MKTKTEKELEREIEEYQKDNKNYYFECNKCGRSWNNPVQIHCPECHTTAEKVLIQEGYFKELHAKLEGYRLAKEEFNKKVEEETLRLEANLVNSLKSKDWEIINKYFGIFREEIDKIFKEEK